MRLHDEIWATGAIIMGASAWDGRKQLWNLGEDATEIPTGTQPIAAMEEHQVFKVKCRFN